MITGSADGFAWTLTVPDGYNGVLIVLLGHGEIMDAGNGACLNVSAKDWNHDFSPWRAEKVFRDGSDFTGGAGEFLEILIGKILPEAEKYLPSAPIHRGIAGYSLAGLCALWAIWQTDVFDRIACLSGSVWFDGFMEYITENPPKIIPEIAVFSLGGAEKKTKNPRMATVEDCMRACERRLQELGTKTDFTLHPGGHFAGVPERIAQGIEKISQI